MRGHEHEHEAGGEPQTPRQAERGAAPDALLAKAAASGRTDVLGAAGWLRLQRTLGNGTVAAMAEEDSPVHAVVGGAGGDGGRPLEPEVRGDMEARLGADFGDVRVHTDPAAHESARAVNAHAYTVGSHVVFQRDAYDPGSHQGRTTLAHELTHVVQQRSGPVDGTDTGGGVRVSDPSDRFEQEAAATAARVVQREEEPVEEEAPAE
jgi:hypothetical protein